MMFSPWLLAGALALPAVGMAAQAQAAPASPSNPPSASVALSAEQAQALGVRFEPIQAAQRIEVSAHARVVLRPDAQAVVAAPYAGAVPRVLVALGQTVRTGQPVAVFTSPQLYEARRALLEAESQSRLARQALARDQALHEDGIIAASRWQATQARAAEAAAMAQARRAELAASGLQFVGNEVHLVAPRAGLVTEVLAVPGARVEASAPLLRVADPKALELDLLLGREVPLPGVGDRVQVAARGAQGKVAGMAPVGDGSAGMRVRVALERAGDLRVGESVTASLALAGADAGPSGGSGGARLRVPAAALAHWNNRTGVFVATGQGARFMPLSVEASDEATAVVRGTLPPKARIAVTGIAALKGLLGGGE
ncbi:MULTISPECIES: efflux RND transporter periplasmic adaptor subunit [unclassified Delftia]|uniref:efflux RND transporter periplasmic adaptor subunit n=1 Tax=unclassified Delftia TaxID=2613839 RepID=UPI001153C502|nr:MULTISPECIES: efflux RND transporter periplasmic adaptor subunit [unclassified Delftia]MCB4786682.1 efflux RND transporter periplasmic adaptor subunit [Delftia sp. Lp-1]TQL81027.1 multidrug efflux pump subunit AcrA (membrane-fusion protein) [Delftia sp. HK171]